MHHQSLNFPKPSFGKSARHDDISLIAALDNSHKQKSTGIASNYRIFRYSTVL
jgi:hypothetical protein